MPKAFRTFSFLYKRTSNLRGKSCEGKFSVQKLGKKKEKKEERCDFRYESIENKLHNSKVPEAWRRKETIKK